jgi:hypothetical protein
MEAETSKLRVVETNLKQLMADVSRAMEKAEAALTRVANRSAASAPDTNATSSH